MSQEGKPIVKEVALYHSIKYFVSSLNTPFGHHLVNRLRNDQAHPENPHRIIGTTVSSSKMGVAAGVRKVIDTSKIKFFEEVVLNSDVIIYDLTSADLKEAEFVITTLKIHPFSDCKTLICISNVMTWARTLPKLKKEGEEEEGDQNPPEEADSEEEGGAQVAEGQQKKTFVRFTDKDFALRKAAPQYQQIKSIETLCLSAGSVKENLKSYVVCGGLQYGQGQGLFSEYFMKARLQKPAKLPVLGKGKNRIPTVHTADLVTYVQKIIEKQPKVPYILAVDHNPKPTQRKMVEAISKGIGTGLVEAFEAKPSKETAQVLLDLRLKPTMVFAKLQEEEAAIESEEGVEVVRFKFPWRSRQGMQKSIQALRQEFNKAHKLKQEKVLVMGPPGSGKTYFSKHLGEKYYLPHISIKTLIEEVMQLKTELGEEVKAFMAEKKESQVGAKQAEYDESKEKWKKIPKDQRQPMAPFDPEAVDVRLSDELVFKCLRWRLSQNDCLNRGYVLDGYPRRYEEAREIFLSLPPVAEGEEPDENAQKVLDERLAPTKLVVLDMTDQDIIHRIQLLPEIQVVGTHLTEARIPALLKRYRTLHDPESGEFVLKDFFEEQKIPCHRVKVGPQTAATLESLVKELRGDQQQQRRQIEARLKEGALVRQEARAELDKQERITRDIQNQDYVMKKENQQNEEREILDKKSLALRKYLDINLVPILSEGIVELLNSFPKDPVDNLAEFLFSHSLKVPNPDPSTFQF